jgi:hypothetical protein
MPGFPNPLLARIASPESATETQAKIVDARTIITVAPAGTTNWRCSAGFSSIGAIVPDGGFRRVTRL